MRADATGLLWDDPPGTKRGKREVYRPMPPIPDTGWQCPSSFPRLGDAKVLSIDTETKDNGLEEGKGPGWAWDGGGHIVGISVGTEDGYQWYFPMRHDVGGRNLNPESVLAWARDEFGRENQPKIGANLLYDLGWLDREGVIVRGKLIDVQYAEPLLDEHAKSYTLSTLAHKYGLITEDGKGSAEKALYQWCADAYGGSPGRKQAANIWRAPVALVGPYGEEDTRLPIEVWKKQKNQLKQEGLLDLFSMECSLIPLYLEMRKRGVRVDVSAAEKARIMLLDREALAKKELSKIVGGNSVDVNSAAWLEKAFKAQGIPCIKTAKGNPSFDAAFLDSAPGRMPELIRTIRKYEKLRGTFLNGYILGHAKNGRLHGCFHPLRTDAGGTVSGRFSSSDPNLQNLPSRDEEGREMLRGLFLPEEGEQWFAPDYKEIEYRLFAHASGHSGLIQAYKDPKTSFHVLVSKMLGGVLIREIVKNFNFMLLFGGGKKSLVNMLRQNLTREEARHAIKMAKIDLQKG